MPDAGLVEVRAALEQGRHGCCEDAAQVSHERAIPLRSSVDVGGNVTAPAYARTVRPGGPTAHSREGSTRRGGGASSWPRSRASSSANSGSESVASVRGRGSGTASSLMTVPGLGERT